MRQAHAVLAALLDLVLPSRCAGCDLPGTALCPCCLEVLEAVPRGLVRPDPCPPNLPPVQALGSYVGPLQRLLLQHKEQAALRLSAPLGQGVARLAWALDPGPFVLCPVPSSRAATRVRGYDHTWRLASAAARTLRGEGLRVAARRLLAPARATADQSRLTTAQRAANLDGAMRARAFPAVRVVVVDDVMTTGATLAEAGRALSAGGHDVLGAVVLAATVKRFGSTGF